MKKLYLVRNYKNKKLCSFIFVISDSYNEALNLITTNINYKLITVTELCKLEEILNFRSVKNGRIYFNVKSNKLSTVRNNYCKDLGFFSVFKGKLRLSQKDNNFIVIKIKP